MSVTEYLATLCYIGIGLLAINMVGWIIRIYFCNEDLKAKIYLLKMKEKEHPHAHGE